MRIAIILGTRPEIIKMSPVIRACEQKSLDFFILHTGQHYSYQMDEVFFQDLEIPEPSYNLNAGSGSHAEQTARIMSGVEKVLEKEKPTMALVQGDTNTVLAGALSASKMHIRIGHVEAGLRSFDKRMPEEINRIVTDHISDHLFTPTKSARENLIREGISENKILLTGNTIVDSLIQNKGIADRKFNLVNEMKLSPKGYFLATIHRAENVDDEKKLREILRGFKLIRDEFSLPIIFPAHPRTRSRISKLKLELDGIKLLNPLGYLEFLTLEANARLVLTDSGGVQEETCVLGVRCVTLRDNTERPETLEVGSNILAGANSRKMMEATKSMIDKKANWKNPFGDGKAGEIIVESL